jgi:hypothetical protein
MEQQRDHDRPCHVGQLARQHQGQISNGGVSPQRLLADAAMDEIGKVGVGQPLDGQESVQEPDVQVVVLVPSPPRLPGGKAGEGRLDDVAVDANDVGVAVVEVVVRVPPQPRTGTPYPSTRFNRAERVNAPWFESCMTLVAVATTATINVEAQITRRPTPPSAMTRPQYAAKAIAAITSALRCARRHAPEISAMVGMINWVKVDSALAPADVRVPTVTVDLPITPCSSVIPGHDPNAQPAEVWSWCHHTRQRRGVAR